MLFVCVACSSDDISIEEGNDTPIEDAPDAYHDRIREYPYPKQDNEIFLNPPPLIVPEKMREGERLQFSLSKSEDFSDASTITSSPVLWNMYNPHRTLDPGIWYWRFRGVTTDGVADEWSDTYQFAVQEETPRFVTPEFRTFFNNLPHNHPRLFCFLDGNIEAARKKVTRHREYRYLIGRADKALAYDYASHSNPYEFAATEIIKPHIDNLYQAYHLTGNTAYQYKMVEVLRQMLNRPVSDTELFASNFGSTNIAIILAQVYDIAFAGLTAAERTATEELMLHIARYYFKMYCGMEENRFFDNHFWQHNMRVLFQMAFMLFDKYGYAEETSQMLEYYYELWTARAPNAGYNRSGVWKNGVGYFTANVKTLYYMPSLFSSITGANFLEHPWYQNAGQALVYAWPPQSSSAGFGDGSENGTKPDRQRVAFADFLARETGDAYAAWYASQCDDTLIEDLDLRLYRMVDPKSYNGAELPENAPNMLWHEDAGEVAIHSNLGDIQHNLSLSFRSSPFGSNSHTLADQNSFVLLYRGSHIFRNGGYYVGAQNTPYNLLWYRHTRNHNSVLVNGIGQPYSLTGYGRILRAIGGEHMAYCMGDASNAYNGISEERAWVETFSNAGITQTPDNGFGQTPLKKYLRHIVVLYPSTVLIYDELEATEPVRWDWLLHSPTPFGIEANERILTTNNTEKNFYTKVHQFSDESPVYAQTTETIIPITPTPNPKYPDLWHLAATFQHTAQTRILTVIQVAPNGEHPAPVSRVGNKVKIGNWDVEAELDVHREAVLTLRHNEHPVVFSYGSGSVGLQTGEYDRKQGNSSVLYDRVNGAYTIQEMSDRLPVTSRASGGF